MNGKVRAFNGDMGMAMSVFKDMVGKVRFVFADPPYKITQARYDKEGFDYKSMWEVIQKMLCYSHPSGMDRWEYKNSQSDCFKQSAGYFFSCHTISAIFLYQNTN